MVGEIRSSAKRPASGSDIASGGAVIVIEGAILGLLISVVGIPFVDVVMSGMPADAEEQIRVQLKVEVRRKYT